MNLSSYKEEWILIDMQFRILKLVISAILLLILACYIWACEVSDVVPYVSTSTQNQPSDQVEASSAVDFTMSTQIANSKISITSSAIYDVQLNLKLVNYGPGSPAKYNLWIALISDIYPYQEVLEMEIKPAEYEIFSDEYGNSIVEFGFSEILPDSEIHIRIDYRVKVNHLAYDLSDCFGELPNSDTSPELHIESLNPQILALSESLSNGKDTVCEQVRAFYDYIGNELVYSYNGGDWGAQAALGEMGADCTEYASLMVALSRVNKIPARYIVGLYVNSAGEDALARLEHAWLDVYLPGIGWTPMDPTLGRSSITREIYFAGLPPDHIIVSRGRNPSALRGGSYWTHLYWPGNSANIRIENAEWVISPVN